MKRLPLSLLMGLLALPLAADASEVRVSYLLETRPFKAAVAGTPLTLSLHTDSACTGSPAATAVVNSDALALIQPLKRTTPKGGTRPPATSRIEQVMTG